MERLQHDLAHDAYALVWAAGHPRGVTDSATGVTASVYSIRDAATDLWA